MSENIDNTQEIDRLQKIRESLLGEYKELGESLHYAQNDFESGLIKEKRESLATTIKEVASLQEELKA